ncbi:ABC transporter ATP-binding protein, partial [candidate division WOR-3 bacterium]|nr:ABC transporter ATP-binding protein [candidate division WOR-3 bacterium]
TGLDPITSETIIELIKELSNSKKRTTIIITHDIKGFLDFADFILMLDNGNVDFFGNKNEFMKTNNETVKKYLKSAGYI